MCGRLAIWANRNYEEQYKAWQNDYKYGHNNPTMQAVLRKKKELFIELYPTLIMFNEIILSGGTPNPSTTDEIIRLIYKITGVY